MPQRNALGPAYQISETIYDNIIALGAALDAYSREGRSTALSEDTSNYLRHNLTSARAQLDLLDAALRPFCVALPAGDQP